VLTHTHTYIYIYIYIYKNTFYYRIVIHHMYFLMYIIHRIMLQTTI